LIGLDRVPSHPGKGQRQSASRSAGSALPAAAGPARWPGALRALTSLVAAVLLLASCRPTEAPGRVRFETRASASSGQRLLSRLEELLRGQGGRYGFVLEHLALGERFALDERQQFAAASTYKLALAYEVLREAGAGELRLESQLTIEAIDAVEPEPAGGLSVGQRVTVRQALESSMGVSSNAAGHALLRLVGRAQLNRSLARLGLEGTRVPPDAGPFGLWRHLVGPGVATTTPEDMARLLRLLGRGDLLDRAGQAELRRLLLIPEALDPLANGLPPPAVVLTKVGNLEAASNVAGLVETGGGVLVVSIYSQGVDPDEARQVCGQLGRALYDFYTE
jgi:beta-lactamase class A